MSFSNPGSPSAANKRAYDRECLSFALCNEGEADLVVTFADIKADALARAAAETWNTDDTPVTVDAADGGYFHFGKFHVASCPTKVLKADGTLVQTMNDDASVEHSIDGASPGKAYSGDGGSAFGGGSMEDESAAIDENDTLTIKPGGAICGDLFAVRPYDVNKSGVATPVAP